MKFNENSPTPVQLSFEEGKEVMTRDPDAFRRLVQESLRRQVNAINKLSARGLRYRSHSHTLRTLTLSHSLSCFHTLIQIHKQAQAYLFIHLHSDLRFWDYGNSFLLEASRAGADVTLPPSSSPSLSTSPSSSPSSGAINQFRYPSYVQDIMGDIFSLGFGPFRWVCSSQDPRDLCKMSLMRLIEKEGEKENKNIFG